MKAPSPPNEPKRLAALRQLEVLDTPPELAFDDLTLLATQICQTPIALVSLVDETRQWFKSRLGLDATETSRDLAFCAHAILQPNDVMEVRDAAADPRFADNPLVRSDPRIRFYAGAPLVTSRGEALGALCVMDKIPRELTAEQSGALRALGRQVVAQLELRRQTEVLTREATERQLARAQLHEQFDQLTASKAEADRLLEQAHKSRRALLSVLEDEQRAAQSLRESEDRFRQLAGNIDEVFWISDPTKQEMLYISPAYEKIWGRTCASLYAAPQSWFEAIHPEERDRVGQAAAARLVEGNYNEEYRILRPDQSVRWIHDRAFPIFNAAGQVLRVVGVARDITEQRRLEEQFRQSQKMEAIGQLAAGVAHDFNNILAVIQMQAGLLRSESGLPPDYVEYATEIEKASQRAANLTRQLLIFSGRQALQPRDLDFNESISHITKMLQRILGEDIHMQIRYAAEPLFIHATAGLMDQILINLTVNSRDAMPGGGELTIGTASADFDETTAGQTLHARPGSFVCLSVSDSGCGIPPEALPRIFEPFFTTKSVGRGTGLGLATVFGIVQQHQGWINVSSQPEHGTTFRVYLPRIGDVAGKKSLAAPRASAHGGDETILVVEDDPALRAVVRNALSRLGYRVIEAPTGVSALEVWRQNRAEIRLLLTDLVLPDGMTGRELAGSLLKEEPKLKVIYASGYSPDLAGKDFPLEPGVNFLPKPFPIAQLAQTVRGCLDKN